MTKKFKVSFSSMTTLSPSIVYISPNEDHFLVGILHQVSSVGTFDSVAGIIKNFDFKQNVTTSEQEALNWATDWLAQKAGCTISLNKVAIESPSIK